MSGRMRRALRLGAVLTLVFVIAPNVLYLGHSALGPLAPAAAHDNLDDPAEAEEHAAHCHLGPSKCTGQSSAVSVSWADESTWSLSTGGRLTGADSATDIVLAEGPVFRVTPPPKQA
jgi:hypothetical protein